jgi:hypothetical protein
MKGRYVLGVGALLLLGGCSSTEQFAKDDPGIMSEIAEAQESLINQIWLVISKVFQVGFDSTRGRWFFDFCSGYWCL